MPTTRHPLADERGVLLVHMTRFNDLFWDCGRTPIRVIEHGIADAGLRCTGRLPRLAFVMNEPGSSGISGEVSIGGSAGYAGQPFRTGAP